MTIDGSLVFALFVLGIIIGFGLCENQLKREAVSHGQAHYDVDTGKFSWNDEVTK